MNDDDQGDDHNSYVNLIYGATGGGVPFTNNEFNILNNTTKSSHKKRDISLNRYLSVDEGTSNYNNENTLLNNNVNISPKIISSNITIRSSRHPPSSTNSLQNRTNTPSSMLQQTVQKSNTSIPQHQQQQQHTLNSQALTFSNSSLERKKHQKTKTTSDSNVKLLADHNFYHATNRNNNNNGFTVNNQIPAPPTISSSSSTSSSLSNKASNEKNEELFKNMLFNNCSNNSNMIEVSKPYELSDFYKYSTRYRNSNSSTGSSSTTNTNNLLMINTAINNNNYENNEQLQKLQIHSTPNDSHIPLQTKYSNRILNTPPSSSSTAILYDSLQYLHTNGNSPKMGGYPIALTHNNSTNDVTTSASNLTNNNSISLNLSIHTAEEFGKEMLAWLQNEHKRNNSSSNLTSSTNAHHIHITANTNDSNTAATLV